MIAHVQKDKGEKKRVMLLRDHVDAAKLGVDCASQGGSDCIHMHAQPLRSHL